MVDRPPSPDSPASEPSTPDPSTPERSAPTSPYEFPTEALLDEQDTATDALRADLDALRRQLDRPPPPLAPPRPRPHGRLFGALISVVTFALIATVAVLFHRARYETEFTATTGPSATSSASPSAPGSPGAPGAPDVAPADRLPSTGPGVTAPGTMMLVQVGADGRLDVTEQAILGPRGLDRIALRLPSMAALGGQVAALNPTVQALRVAVNGTPVAATPTADGPGWAVAPADREPARTVQLSYQVQDAIVRTRPSDDGRALGVSLPLLGQALRDQGLPLIVRAEGAGVGGVSCPSAPATRMLCGLKVDGGWLATIPSEAASPTLLLQLTLT